MATSMATSTSTSAKFSSRIALYSVLLAAVVVISLLIWTSLSAYHGAQTRGVLEQLAKEERIENLKQDKKGLFASSGFFDIRLPQVNAAKDANGRVLPARNLRIHYLISHFFLPDSVAKFKWQATLTGPALSEVNQRFMQAAVINGVGVINHQSNLQGEFDSPTIAIADPNTKQSIDMAASKGRFTLNKEKASFVLEWKMPQALLQNEQMLLKANDLALQIDASPRYLGKGWRELSIARVETRNGSEPPFVLQNTAIRTEIDEHDALLDATVTATMARLTTSNKTITPIKLQFGIQNVDAESLRTLGQPPCANNGAWQKNEKCKHAATDLFDRGFTAGLYRINANSNEGNISGHALFNVLPNQGEPQAWMLRLHSEGALQVSAKIFSREKQKSLIKQGLARSEGDNLALTYQYAPTGLLVNNQPAAIDQLLATLFQALMPKNNLISRKQ